MTISARITAASCLLTLLTGPGSAWAQSYAHGSSAEVAHTGPVHLRAEESGGWSDEMWSGKELAGSWPDNSWLDCRCSLCTIKQGAGPPTHSTAQLLAHGGPTESSFDWPVRVHDEKRVDWGDEMWFRVGLASSWLRNSRYDDACPLWTVKQDAVLLTRSEAEPLDLLFAPLSVLNVADLRFDHEAGPRFGIARRLGGQWGLEVEYLSIDGWTASAVRDGSPLILFPPGVMASTQFAVEYDSQLYSTELNSRYRVSNGLDLLVGYRYVELQEDFRVTGQPMPPQDLIPRYNTHAANNMHGFQIGTVIHPPTAGLFDCNGLLSLEGFLKAGIYSNHARQQTFRIGNLGIPRSAGDHRDRTAFLGELGLTVICRLGEHMALRAGYQAMWIEGVALAPDQIPFTDVNPLNLASATLNASGSLFYHGTHVGLEARW